MRGGLPLANQLTREERDALEKARAQLEVTLGSDENWRALRQAGQEAGASGVDEAGRRARNTRLELALAGNAHYLAWKRVSEAIAGQMTSESGPPHAARRSGGIAALLAEVEGPLRSGSAPEAPATGQGGGPVEESRPQPAGRLIDRLGDLNEDDGGAGPSRRRKVDEKATPPVSADPPEATVTFVVRETRAPMLPSADLSPDLGTQRSSNLFERLRGLRPTPAQPADRVDAAATPVEEAEVTIISAEGLRLRREAEERAGFIQRFRKALSGD
jgi:hypothetical protein